MDRYAPDPSSVGAPAVVGALAQRLAALDAALRDGSQYSAAQLEAAAAQLGLLERVVSQLQRMEAHDLRREQERRDETKPMHGQFGFSAQLAAGQSEVFVNVDVPEDDLSCWWTLYAGVEPLQASFGVGNVPIAQGTLTFGGRRSGTPPITFDVLNGMALSLAGNTFRVQLKNTGVVGAGTAGRVWAYAARGSRAGGSLGQLTVPVTVPGASQAQVQIPFMATDYSVEVPGQFTVTAAAMAQDGKTVLAQRTFDPTTFFPAKIPSPATFIQITNANAQALTLNVIFRLAF